MNQLRAQAIILSRTNYGEADRIITLLTPDQGKLRLMARGSRRIKSKLAGGIELFSVSDITYIRGKGDIGTLVSARLHQHFGNIVQHIDRTMLGYELTKRLNRATEDQPEPEYFALLQEAFAALDQPAISTDVINAWFTAQLLSLDGHQPNLHTDRDGQKLDASRTYTFDYDAVSFAEHPEGHFAADQIKFLRLLFSATQPRVLHLVSNAQSLVQACLPLIQTMQQTYIRV